MKTRNNYVPMETVEESRRKLESVLIEAVLEITDGYCDLTEYRISGDDYDYLYELESFISSLLQSFADEVREKVIRKDEPTPYEPPTIQVDCRNQLRQVQRQALTDLCKKYGLEVSKEKNDNN